MSLKIVETNMSDTMDTPGLEIKEPSLYAQYLKEREGISTLETSDAFATYVITGEECYIRDIWVRPDCRQRHIASQLADKIAAIAKQSGCKILIGSVAPVPSATHSMKVLLGYGMRFHLMNQNGMFFVKDLV